MTTQSETDLPREESSAIDRREAIRRVTAMLGGLTLVGGSSLVAACQRERRPGPRVPIGEFTVADIDLLDEVADTILPETKTPGAKAANVGAFMALMVTDTYKPEDRQVFRDGMRSLDALCFQSNKAAFVAAKPEQRLALLEKIDREAKTYMDLRSEARKAREKSDTTAQTNASPPPADPPTHYFRMMKELALLGYFTSEIGCTQALRYVEMPGRFDPCVDYKPGDRAWAGHA
jgi:glucoside 3-dehydrogenase (cytochrome c) hitch-hiker subunit